MTTDACEQAILELREARHELDRAREDNNRFLATTPLDRGRNVKGFSLDEIRRASERLKKTEAAVKEKERALRECVQAQPAAEG
jgi:hypothetical protein